MIWDYGYNIHQMLSYWTDFDVEVLRFSNQSIDVLGEYAGVMLSTKRWSESVLKNA